MNPLIAAMIKLSGHSWWQARYLDGKVLSEWDTLKNTTLLFPIGSGQSSRWEEIPKKGMVGLRLLCPNGMAGELEAPEGYLFFQLKVGGLSVSIGYGGRPEKSKRFITSHIIGVVEDLNGNCLCRAWEYPQYVMETYRLCWKCGRVSKTEFCKCRQDLRGIAPVDRARLRTFTKRELIRPGQLVEFRDNIYNIRYRNIGRLSLNVQQVKV